MQRFTPSSRGVSRHMRTNFGTHLRRRLSTHIITRANRLKYVNYLWICMYLLVKAIGLILKTHQVSLSPSSLNFLRSCWICEAVMGQKLKPQIIVSMTQVSGEQCLRAKVPKSRYFKKWCTASFNIPSLTNPFPAMIDHVHWHVYICPRVGGWYIHM